MILENRKTQAVLISLGVILASIIAGALVLLLLGKNPLEAYLNLLKGCGLFPKSNYAGSKNMLSDFTSFLNALTPMIFAALAVGVALKAGLFNIGVAGQMLTAGFIASVTVGYTALAAPLAKPLAVVMGILAGAVVGGMVGWLKYRFNINEVVSTIMMNYIAQYVIGFFIHTRYINPVSRQSALVHKNARLTLMDVQIGNIKLDLPIGILIAVAAALLVWFLFKRTKVGFEMRAVGISPDAARYAGMNVGKNMVLTMVISGGLAGLAGVTYYMGLYGSIQPGVLPGTGFDGIAVALLGNLHPIGIVFASFLVTVISKGSTYMSSASGVEAEIAAVITGLILLFSACQGYVSSKIKLAVLQKKKGDRKND